MKIRLRLKNAKIASAIGFLILIALIWFIGPFFGLPGIESRLKWIFGVMALWVLSLLIGQLFAVRAGRLLEKMLHRQADEAVMEASAARRAEVNQLRERLLAAIHTLKKRGNAALYELPWYMIIGHPAAGKSTALLQSGLTFPFADQGNGIHGVGGTRNCDWFFSTEGILLDTAGRYATQLEDRGEWLSFLKLLKRYRSKAPVNGILVATSLAELVQWRSEDFTLYARRIRERINEIEETFGLRVPVYLVFTKLDLLGGFGQFFEDIDESDRNRVWGATLAHEQGEGFDICREIERQCEFLFRGLRQIGEDKLAISRGAVVKQALFAFPLEFHGLKDGVVRLVELLHEEDPYHARPLLRGFYFTSALQAGEPPCIAAAARVSSRFGLTRNSSETPQPQSSHGYFLRDLFREVLFPDQYLIMRQTRPRVSRLRLAGMLGGSAVLIAITALLTGTYTDNRDLVAHAGKTSSQASGLIAGQALYGKLQGLTLLQKQLEALPHHQGNGVPLWDDMGLYKGKKLETALRKQYFDGLRTVMMEPLQTNLEKVLEQKALEQSLQQSEQESPQAYQAAYGALKTYLMLSERPRLDADWLSGQIPLHWRSWLDTNRGTNSMEEIEAETGQIKAFYISQLKAPDLPLIGTQPLVVENARLALRSQPNKPPDGGMELVYEQIKASGNARFPAITVARILEGRDAGVLTSKTAVPGVFTRDAYEKYVRQAIDEASRGEIKGDDWVLATLVQEATPGRDADINEKRAKLEAMYREDYGDAWLEFLQELSIAATPGDILQAEKLLERLADPRTSPLKIVLQRINFETSWDNPAPLSSSVVDARQTVITRAGNLIGSPRATPQIPRPQQDSHYGELGKRFAPLAIVVADSSGRAGVAPLMVGYQEHLSNLKGQFNLLAAGDDQATAARKLMQATLDSSGSEFVDTMQYIDNTMLNAIENQDFKNILRPLLASPLLKSYATLLPPVERELNEIWQSEIYDQWQMLADKYPFSNSRNEASLGEITRFIKPGGALDKFIGENMNGLVTRRGGQFVPRLWSELGVRINASFLTSIERLSTLGRALARDGNEAARFELRPVPTPGLSEITLEIDGQSLRYRNGPQPWQTFTWPGDDARAQGARIQVVAFDGTASTVSSQPGRMGLMRMIGESTRNHDQNMNSGQMTWRFNGPPGANIVKFDFRMSGGLNPLQLTALSRIELPRRITQ